MIKFSYASTHGVRRPRLAYGAFPMASLLIRSGVLRKEPAITSIGNQPSSTANEAPRLKSGSRKGDRLVRRPALNEDLLLA